MLFSIAFTELLSGNMVLPVFAHPVTLVLLCVVYGFPALLARDLIIRRRLGLPSLLLLGLAYGIYNEGIVAKTLMLEDKVPIGAFDHYGFALGLNWSWATIILPWHAMHSIVFPIAINDMLFPNERNVRWLGDRGCRLILLATVAIGGLAFISKEQRVAASIYLVPLSLAIAALILAAYQFAGRGELSDSVAPAALPRVAAGFLGYYAWMLGLLLIAGARLPIVLFFAYAGLLLYIAAKCWKHANGWSVQTVALVGLGSYLAIGLFRLGTFAISPLPLESLGVGTLLSVLILSLIRTITRGQAHAEEST